MPQSRTSADLRCPACDASIDGNHGRVPAAVDGETVRVALECTVCAEALELTTTGDVQPAFRRAGRRG